MFDFFYAASAISYDVGIVADCTPSILAFARRLPILKNDVRFLAIHWSMCDRAYPSNLRGHPLFVSSSKKPFSRARNVNLLQRMSNGTYFIIVDTDMLITQSALDHVRRRVTPGVAYFPIVWSQYSPTSIKLVERFYNRKLKPRNEHTGFWRDFGYGMFALHKRDVRRFAMDERFVGWGGEDNDFYARVKRATRIVRKKDRGFVHVWHPQRCDNITSPKYKHKCVSSKASAFGSKLAMMLWMLNDTRVRAET